MSKSVPILIAVAIAAALAYFALRMRGDAGTEARSPAAARGEASADPFDLSGPIEPGAEREVAGETAEDGSAAAPSPAVLAVHVVAKEDHRPLPSVRLTVHAKDQKVRSFARDVEENRGTLEASPRTDWEGRAEFALPPNVDLAISARTANGSTSSAYLDVPALEPGGRRDLMIELLTKNDLVFHGRVLAREDRRPIPQSAVHVESPDCYSRPRNVRTEPGSSPRPPFDVATDPEGRFELQLASWQATWAEVSAPGFGSAYAVLDAGHETLETESTILLDRAATLKFHLLESGRRPASGVSVRATTESYHVKQPEGVMLNVGMDPPDPTWRLDTGADGRCTLERLPAGAPLRVEVVAGARVLRREAEPIVLRPGEVREIEWTLGSGCKLSGRVLDENGARIAGQEVWVLGAEMGKAEYLVPYAEEKVVGRAKSSDDGRYEIDDLSPGRLLVGPAPSRKSEDAVAPLAVVVEIPEGATAVERDLVVYRGLYIRGYVLDPTGAPAVRQFVMGTSEEATLHETVQSGDDGSFAFGPLAPGRYTLEAAGAGQFATSDPVEAAAGDEHVVLRLRAGGSLVGSVVDAKTGAPCQAEIAVSPRDPSALERMRGTSHADGSFRFGGLRVGAYDVAAGTPDGRVGSIRGLVVDAEGRSDALVIRVEPGARLRVRYQGRATWGSLEVASGGMPFSFDGLRAGTSTTCTVPAGHVVARFKIHDPPSKQEKELDLAVGEEKEVVFDD